jgi:hypothetical protein
MTPIVELPVRDWTEPCPPHWQERALAALEQGGVLLLPELAFPLDSGELALVRSGVGAAAKNISLDPSRGQLRGSEAGETEQDVLLAMMVRFGEASRDLLGQILPTYSPHLQQARTSFRPTEIEGRRTSWRKDDTRLHVDSFPSSPTHGRRILRVFCNINPAGRPRVWKLGQPFDAVAEHFLPAIAAPAPGSAALLRALRITKTRRSAYDHYMLQLHDRMKADLAYQTQVPQHIHEFLPGQTWIVYTDQVSHAALRGQHALEQTYTLEPDSMGDPALSPLGVLQRRLGQPLL